MTNPLRPSPLVAYLRAHGSLQAGATTLVLARTTGMCRGVERALSLVDRTRAVLSPDRRLFLLRPLIHNPTVGQWLTNQGIITLDTESAGWSRDLAPNDTVIIPAFGATVDEEALLHELGVAVVDTTCPSVRAVWTRVAAYAREGFVTVLHGRSDHPETRATLSRATAEGGHYVVVRDTGEAARLGQALSETDTSAAVSLVETIVCSAGFDPIRHLTRIGMANQTTMLAEESQAVASILRKALVRRWGPRGAAARFRAFGTICRATQQRQDAVQSLTESPLDVLFVVGGHASSNTRHLAELGSRRVPTLHIEGPQGLLSLRELRHQPPGTRDTAVADISWLAQRQPRTIGFAGGASTPDAELGDAMIRVLRALGEPIPPAAEEECLAADEQTDAAPSTRRTPMG